jgi:hypothetical protein
MATLWSWCFPLLQCDGDRTRSQVVQTHSRRTSVPVLLIGTVQWGPTTRRIRENASDQSVGDGFGLDDQVSGDQLQQHTVVAEMPIMPCTSFFVMEKICISFLLGLYFYCVVYDFFRF